MQIKVVIMYAREIPGSSLIFSDFEYPKELIPKHAEYHKITNFDKNWCDFYTEVALQTSLDYGRVRTQEQKRIDNFYGLLGEKIVKDKLRKMQVLYTYNERDPEFFVQYKEPFDFAIPTNQGKFFTLEIKTAKELGSHTHIIIRKGEWKKSDYTIAVKMLRIDIVNQIAFAFIGGYLTKQEISKLPVLKNEYPCFKYPGRAKELNKMHPIKELWDIIDSEAIHW